jgi:hypothetical protein
MHVRSCRPDINVAGGNPVIRFINGLAYLKRDGKEYL